MVEHELGLWGVTAPEAEYAAGKLAAVHGRDEFEDFTGTQSAFDVKVVDGVRGDVHWLVTSLDPIPQDVPHTTGHVSSSSMRAVQHSSMTWLPSQSSSSCHVNTCALRPVRYHRPSTLIAA